MQHIEIHVLYAAAHAVFLGRHPHHLLKYLGEVFFVLKSHLVRDLIIFQIALLQITAGPADTDLVQIVYEPAPIFCLSRVKR